MLLFCMFLSSFQHVVVVAAAVAGAASQGQDRRSSSSSTSATSRRVQSTPVKTPTKAPAASVPVSPTKVPLAVPTTIMDTTRTETPTFLKATTAPPTVMATTTTSNNNNNSNNATTTETDVPTRVPRTKEPTPSPTKMPTTPEPTDTPTTMAPTYPEGAWIPIQADITMKLSPVNGYLQGDTESFFLYAVQEVVLSSLIDTNPTITDLQVELVSQEEIEGFARFKPAYLHHVRRNLQEDEEDEQELNSTVPEWQGGEKGALKVALNITATERVTFLSVEEQELEQPALTKEEFQFQLNDVIRKMQAQILDILKQGGGDINTAFFEALLAIQIETEAPTQAPAEPTENPTSVATTLSPTTAPVMIEFQWPTDPPNSEVAINNSVDQVDNNDKAGPFDYSLLLIIASAAGGALLLALAFVCCRRLSSRKRKEGGETKKHHHHHKNGVVDTSGSNSPSSSSDAGQKKAHHNAAAAAPPSTQRKPYKPANHQQPILMKQSSYDSTGRQGDSDADADSASMAMYSYVQGGGDQGSFMGETLGGGTDAMSYAYSLEAGFEPSIADSDSFGMQVPMEIPQLGMIMTGGGGGGRPMGGNNYHNNTTTAAMGGGSSHLHSASMVHGGGAGTSAYQSNDREIELENSLIEITTSDLQLTKSELAMLPSDLMGSQNGDSLQDDQSDFDESTLGGTMAGLGDPTTNTNTLSTANGGAGAGGTMSSSAARFVTRTCVAPSGKLGIIIDTTVEGPVVHKVNYGSALTGVVFPGDIIVAIDNVDTRAMSASAITNLMVKTAHQARTLTIISDAK
jgi:hypothetical protein